MKVFLKKTTIMLIIIVSTFIVINSLIERYRKNNTANLISEADYLYKSTNKTIDNLFSINYSSNIRYLSITRMDNPSDLFISINYLNKNDNSEEMVNYIINIKSIDNFRNIDTTKLDSIDKNIIKTQIKILKDKLLSNDYIDNCIYKNIDLNEVYYMIGYLKVNINIFYSKNKVEESGFYKYSKKHNFTYNINDFVYWEFY